MHEDAVGVAVLGIEHGFEAPGMAIVAEQDILGDRMVRPHAKTRRAQHFLAEASSLAAGDLVTHIEHGIGRYTACKRSMWPARRMIASNFTMTAASSSCRSRTSSF